MSSFRPDGSLDIGKGLIIVCQGKKESGKSVLAMVIARSFPNDVIVIDVAGDDGPTGPGVIELHGTVEDLPRQFPESLRPRPGEAMILRYVPDPASATFLEDVDAVVGLAYKHSTKERPALLVVHEQGIVAKVNQVKPHMRSVLMSNRHHGLNCVLCLPRTKLTDILALAQADLVYTFELPSKSDRERTAETIGVPVDEFTSALRRIEPHGFLRFDAREAAPPEPPDGVDADVWADEHPDFRLVEQAPLPLALVKATKEWAANVPRR